MEFLGKESRKIKMVDREETLRIEKFVGEGPAMAHDKDGKVIFVRYVLPGELVRTKIYKEAKDYAIAEPLEILEASPERQKPQCKYFALCGGCDYQMLSYEDQINIKKHLVQEIFLHVANINLKISEVLTSSEEFLYRNTMTYKVNPNKKLIGFFRKDSKSIVDIENCLLEMPSISKVLNDMRIQDTLEDAVSFPKHNFKVRASINGNPSVYWVPSKHYSDIPVYETITVKNKSICYKISKDSFFQVNSYVVPFWLEKIISFLDPEKTEKVVDLYCGIGLITLFVSFYAKETIGVEIAHSSVVDANYNKEQNTIDTNVRFVEGDAGKCLAQIGYADVIIIDPPRAGMDENTRSLLLKYLPKKIIYSSCKTSTMARDISELLLKYEVTEIYLVDMFPQTHHVELLALLTLK